MNAINELGAMCDKQLKRDYLVLDWDDGAYNRILSWCDRFHNKNLDWELSLTNGATIITSFNSVREPEIFIPT
jgi:hypothetical protein